jgi:hypothetical protein
LDKIFGEAAANGGIPPDPEEIQELLMKAQGRSIRYKIFFSCIFLDVLLNSKDL